MIRFYREKGTGDYLLVDWSTKGRAMLDARAPFLARCSASICSTTVDPKWLRAECRAVPRSDVPEEWMRMLV